MNKVKSVIHVEDLTMAYRETPVLWDIDLDIPSEVRCAIVGPNGAGKSTLLGGILGLIPPVSGQVRLWGHPLEEVRKRIAYVPQRGSVHWDFPTTVFDVVLMGRYAHIGLMRRPGKLDKELALAVHHDLSTLDAYFDFLVVLNRTVKACDYLRNVDKEEKLALAYRIKE